MIRRTAWIAWWIGLALRVLQLWLATHPDSGRVFMAFGIGPLTFAASMVFGTAASAVGVVMASRLPRNRFGWIWVAVGMSQAILATLLLIAADHASGSRFGVIAGIIASVGVAVVPFAATAIGLLTFPTGTLIGRRWRALLGVTLGAIAIRGLEIAFGTPEVFLLPTVANPFLLGPPVGSIIQASQHVGLGVGLVLVTTAACLASVVVRYRRADSTERRQFRWVVLGSGGFVATLVPAAYVYLVVGTLEAATSVVFALTFIGFSLLPLTTLIAITRYRLYEIDRLVNRALLYGSLTAILAGVFTAAIALAQRLFIVITGERSDAAIVLTTLVVATAYAPLRRQLEARIDRRFKYDRGSFGEYWNELTLQRSLWDPAHAAERLAGEIVATLRSVGAAVLSESGAVTAVAGTWPVAGATTIPIVGGHGSLAVMAAGPRLDGAAHDSGRLAELGELATLVAQVARDDHPAPSLRMRNPRR
jgi:hypothetical protein